MNYRGQALVEWALLAPLFVFLFIGIFTFGEWFLIRQELLMTAKEGAFLFSTGRIEKPRVVQHMCDRLQKGFPALKLPTDGIHIDAIHGLNGFLMELDQVKVTYHPAPLLLRYFSDPMEELCVIKHAPPYRLLSWPLTFGPPVKWPGVSLPGLAG